MLFYTVKPKKKKKAHIRRAILKNFYNLAIRCYCSKREFFKIVFLFSLLFYYYYYFFSLFIFVLLLSLVSSLFVTTTTHVGGLPLNPNQNPFFFLLIKPQKENQIPKPTMGR